MWMKLLCVVMVDDAAAAGLEKMVKCTNSAVVPLGPRMLAHGPAPLTPGEASRACVVAVWHAVAFTFGSNGGKRWA